MRNPWMSLWLTAANRNLGVARAATVAKRTESAPISWFTRNGSAVRLAGLRYVGGMSDRSRRRSRGAHWTSTSGVALRACNGAEYGRRKYGWQSESPPPPGPGPLPGCRRRTSRGCCCGHRRGAFESRPLPQCADGRASAPFVQDCLSAYTPQVVLAVLASLQPERPPTTHQDRPQWVPYSPPSALPWRLSWK